MPPGAAQNSSLPVVRAVQSRLYEPSNDGLATPPYYHSRVSPHRAQPAQRATTTTMDERACCPILIKFMRREPGVHRVTETGGLSICIKIRYRVSAGRAL